MRNDYTKIDYGYIVVMHILNVMNNNENFQKKISLITRPKLKHEDQEQYQDLGYKSKTKMKSFKIGFRGYSKVMVGLENTTATSVRHETTT